MIPYDERVNAIMQQRHFLQRAGQIRRKEFMLSDRVNWPSLPELTRQQLGPQTTPRGVPQQMAYPTQPTPGPPAKRARHAPNQGQQPAAPGIPQLDAAVDDEEDISRGDMFDHLTPREISMSRYQQNHEWMEEILSSAYRISQITPADLGLGLKGELASLTEGIFTAQGGDAFNQVPDKAYVGKLDPGKADEFRKRVDTHIETTKAEMEKMEAEHRETMAKFRENSLLRTKEKELRAVVEGSGSEIWRIDGKVSSNDEDAGNSQISQYTVDEIVQQVELATGRKIESMPRCKRVQDGGYQLPAPAPSAPSSAAGLSRQASQAPSQASGLMGESDLEMGGTAAGLLDQMHTGFSSTSTPVNNFPTPQAQASATQSGAATPLRTANTASPAPPATITPVPIPVPGAVAAAAAAAAAAASNASADIEMGGTDESPVPDEARTTPDQGTGSGDWVVVPPKTETPVPAPIPGGARPAAGSEENTPKLPAPSAPKPPSAAATPAVTEGGSTSFDQNDFSSLGDLDTAGDALANYDTPELDGAAGELGEDLDLQMDMEDSAFGDAFHGVSASGTPGGDGQGQDM